jgi:hypothetical protein
MLAIAFSSLLMMSYAMASATQKKKKKKKVSGFTLGHAWFAHPSVKS